jgi:hypothetical protein
VNEIQLLGGFSERMTFVVGSLAAPAKAIRACTEELVTHWQLDAAAHRTLTRRAYPLDPQKLSAAFTYPKTPMARQGGLTRFRLMINATGVPTSCKIIGPGGDSDFGRTTCATLMKAGAFSPPRMPQAKRSPASILAG